MIIKKKRIRNLKRNFPFLKMGEKFYFGIEINSDIENKIKRAGFNKIEEGFSALPSAIGPISLYNSEGKFIKHKNLPKETVYYQREWHWKQWCGRGETEEKSKIVDVPRERYQRSLLAPPSVELTIAKNRNGSKIIISPLVEFKKDSEAEILHIINLLLEIFGECKVYRQDLNEIILTPVKKINWRILPKGEYPWEKLKEEIKPILKKAKQGNVGIIENRIETINNLKPDFCCIGEAGFFGYIILGFTKLNIYLAESAFYGNATYVFNENWRELTKRTKAEILNNNLQKDRLIHKDGWKEKIKKYSN